MIQSKPKLCSVCGEMKVLWKSTPKTCKECYAKTKQKKPIDRMTETKKSEIKESNNYYRQAIALNIIKNKSVCRCDECGSPIKHPTGRNVCHIIGSGANKELYLDKRNNFILGKGEMFGECNCGWSFDESGEKSEMEIYPKYLEIRETLNREYYGN